MQTEVLDNQMRGLNIVLGSLQAAAGEICKSCIGLEGAKTKVGKMVKKLGMDLDAASISCEKTKADLQVRISSLSKAAEELKIAEECECQKTAGNCKLGAECFVNAAVDLMKLPVMFIFRYVRERRFCVFLSSKALFLPHTLLFINDERR